MENASKALIIAAAVLISIVIISVGIKIVSSVKGNTDSAEVVGEKITQKVLDENLKLEYNIVRIPDHQIHLPTDNKPVLTEESSTKREAAYYYANYRFNNSNKIKLKEDVEYIISFDYIIIENTGSKIGCGIGYASIGSPDMQEDFISHVVYPNQNTNKKSTFSKTLLINEKKFFGDGKEIIDEFRKTNETEKYLALRFVRRLETHGTCTVQLSNITIKWKK